MTENPIDAELYSIGLRITDETLPVLWDADRTLETGGRQFDLIAELLCAKFAEPGRSKYRTALSFTFPKKTDTDPSNHEAWQENKDYERLPREFLPLSGEKVVAVIEYLPIDITNLIILNIQGVELFRFQRDRSAKYNNTPKLASWITFDCGSFGDEKIKEVAGLDRKNDPYRMQVALRLLQLVQKRGREDVATDSIKAYFDLLDLH